MRAARWSVGVAVLLQVFCLAPGAFAQERIPIAVFEIRSTADEDRAKLATVADVLANEIRGLGPFQVIGRDDIRALLDLEQQKLLAGCSEDACLADLGGALGVKWLVTGNAAFIGKSLVINLKVLDTQSVFVVSSASRRLEGREELLVDALPGLATEIMYNAHAAMFPDDLPLPPWSETEEGSALRVIKSGAEARPNAWAHGTFWSGLGLLALGGVATGMMVDARDKYQGGDLGREDDIKTWGGVMFGAGAAGLALMITGTVLWLTGGDAAEPDVTVGPADGGTGLSLSGRW
jgi:hypothetical protein